MKRIFFVLVIVLFGCEVEPTFYTLNINSNPTEVATINPTSGDYLEGTEVNIRINTNEFYEFVKWSGDWNGTESPLTLTMDNNKNLTANFILKDTDEDGVTDDIDTCPDTPEGESVDSNGCSSSQVDSDGDGVTDDVDTCPDTPQGESVDENGCSDSQKDTDSDGVTDDIDTCPDTTEGESVDSNGCSSSQVDSDGDTVMDDVDTCPDTPEGESVDSNGCSDSQKDTDSDGVTDDIDTCPDTPEGESVDSNGCSDSQKDTDSDGVTDDVDNCIFTYNPNQSDEDGDGIGNYCDVDYLIDATDLTDMQRSWYPNNPFVFISNHNILEDGYYFVKDKANNYFGEIFKINTNGGNPVWDLRFLKYYTSLTKIYTATMGEFINFTLPESSVTLTEIDMQFHNVNNNSAHILLSNHSNLKRVRIGSIFSIESVQINNLPSLEYLDLSLSNLNGDFLDVDLTNNVGVEVDGVRRIGYVKVLGNLSKIHVDNVYINYLQVNPINQENLEFNTYFDDNINLSGGRLDISYSQVKNLKINNINWLEGMKINDNINCISSDNNDLFTEVIENGTIETHQNRNYYRYIRTVTMSWGDYQLYHDWYISPNTLNLISNNCF